MKLAIRWREVTREAFGHYLPRGYEAREFFRGESVSFYLLVNTAKAPHQEMEDGIGRAGS